MSANTKTADDSYLQHISDPLGGGADKYELSRYLQYQGGVRILEIGPGGGQSLENAIALSEGWHRDDAYFVIDLSRDVLAGLQTSSSIHRYPNVHCVQADAVQLPFHDESFAFINLSSVAHECSSYRGGLDAIRTLAAECSRVLKKSGILIFRDPEGTDLHATEECEISGCLARAFFHLFLPRFLDSTYTAVHKPTFYDSSNVSVGVEGVTYSFADYFSRLESSAGAGRLRVICDSGLIRELQRHYLTFIDAYIPEYLCDYQPALDPTDTVVKFHKRSGALAFQTFLQEKRFSHFTLGASDYVVSSALFKLFQRHVYEKCSRLLAFCGATIPSESWPAVERLLQAAAIPFQGGPGNIKLPLGGLLLIERQLREAGAVLEVDDTVMQWSRREGEEYYFYESFPEVVATFIASSLGVVQVTDGRLSGNYCFAPVESRFVPRDKYAALLSKDFKTTAGSAGSNIREGKRIIHFVKLPVEQAFSAIVDFYHTHDELQSHPALSDVIKRIATTIRDYVSRSLQFNERMQQQFAFANSLIDIEDDLAALEQAPSMTKLQGKNIVLVGRIGTRKEAVILHLERQGYYIVNLTEFLRQEVKKVSVARSDLYEAGVAIRLKYGDNVLAERAVELIRKNNIDKFVIVGCRSPGEVACIKEAFPEAVAVGLFPDTAAIIEQLRRCYPDVSEENIKKWISWNDGMENDQYTNIRVCLEMCEVLFKSEATRGGH
jgi:SAM-dependent methyltransferase